jgi:diaminopimelate epimerase
MRLEFQKLHGTLNDFVVLHDLENHISLSPHQVTHICDRHAGVGADGIIVVRKSSNADFFMDYVNADGSLAEMCGNGIRCLAKYVFDNGLTDKTILPVETRAGIKTVELMVGSDGLVDNVRVNMGNPIFEANRIPVSAKSEITPIIDHPISVLDRKFDATFVSMGNPHCVIFVDEDPRPVALKYGPIIEKNTLFPSGANVEFVRTIGPDRLLMRVWERGSGETLSCGTGACATFVAARLKNLVDDHAVIELLGGELFVSWKGENDPVLMTGSAVSVFSGTITT